MLTSPKEKSALAIVISRNTCELLSLISPQLARSVCAKTGDLLSDCQAVHWLFQHICFFPVCLFCDKGHTESEGNLANRGFPPWKGCQTRQCWDAGSALEWGEPGRVSWWRAVHPSPVIYRVAQFTPKSIPYNYRTAKGPNFHFSNTLYLFLLLLRTPLNSTGILKQT